jgi:phospholipid/cholesterol/gamma-HCH transport system permease protein
MRDGFAELICRRNLGPCGSAVNVHGVFLANSSIAMATEELIDRVGRLALGFFETAGALAVFAGRAVIEAFRPPYECAEILRHLYQFGFRSAPLIVTSGFAIGVVLSMHTRASLERFGAEAMIPAGLAIALVRETGPLTAGLLVSGRVGAGIGAEVGAMRVTEQIDALEASAVDAFKYLVVTRVIACMIAMPLLTTMMNFAGVMGGYASEAIQSGMPWQLYFERSFMYIGFSDLIPATLKTIVFGFLIAIVGGYLGFTTRGGTEGVGNASTRSVVLASILIILSNVILVRIILFFYPQGSA